MGVDVYFHWICVLLLELLVDDWKVLPKSDIVDLNDLKHKDLLVIWDL